MGADVRARFQPSLALLHGGAGYPCRCGARRGGLPSLLPACLAFSLLFCPHPPSPLPGGKGEIISSFRRGLRPRHPGGGSLRFGARGEESVAYRLADAGRVQPRGCKGRSPLHEITLVSPSPMGGRGGGWGKMPFGFRRGLSPGGADSTLDIPFLSALAGRTGPSQYKFEKSSGGSGGLFQESPSVSPASLPPAIAEVQFFRKVVPSLVSTSVTPRSER